MVGRQLEFDNRKFLSEANGKWVEWPVLTVSFNNKFGSTKVVNLPVIDYKDEDHWTAISTN